MKYLQYMLLNNFTIYITDGLQFVNNINDNIQLCYFGIILLHIELY